MSLCDRERRLVRLSAAIALGRWDVLCELRRSAPAGEPDRAWREVVLQSHLFAGFPRTVEACSQLSAAGGLGALDADELAPAPPRHDAGRALFDAIYGQRAAAVRAELAGFHGELAHWIADHAYASVLARPGLAADRRELVAVAALAAQGLDRQLASHARGALRLGATAEEVREALAGVRDLLSAALFERALAVVQHFTREE